MNKQQNQIYDLQQKFLLKKQKLEIEKKTEKQNKEKKKKKTEKILENLSIETKDNTFYRGFIESKKQNSKSLKKKDEQLEMFDNTLQSQLCKTEEFNLTVTRLDNEQVRSHYPITQNDIASFYKSKESKDKIESLPRQCYNIIYQKKIYQKIPSNFDIKEFSLHKNKKLADENDDDDLLFYMLKDKA